MSDITHHSMSMTSQNNDMKMDCCCADKSKCLDDMCATAVFILTKQNLLLPQIEQTSHRPDFLSFSIKNSQNTIFHPPILS